MMISATPHNYHEKGSSEDEGLPITPEKPLLSSVLFFLSSSFLTTTSAGANGLDFTPSLRVRALIGAHGGVENDALNSSGYVPMKGTF